MGAACSCFSDQSTVPPQSTIAPQPQATTASSATSTTVTVQTPEPTATSTDTSSQPTTTATSEPSVSTAANMSVAKVAIVYYSMYGHIKTMALKAAEGLKETGVDVTILRVAETLSDDILAKMHAPPKDESHPVVNVHDLPQYDGFVFATPTRYGAPAAQYKAMWDATGQLWATGALNGKFATTITSTASQGGGQETTHVFGLNNIVHHGMIYVPLGYGNPEIFRNDEAHGGSPWGAGCLAGGDGSRQPSTLELSLAHYQGKRFGEIVAAYKKGKSA